MWCVPMPNPKLGNWCREDYLINPDDLAKLKQATAKGHRRASSADDVITELKAKVGGSTIDTDSGMMAATQALIAMA